MAIKINLPANNTPAMDNSFISKVYHNFFDAISKRLNELSSSQIIYGLDEIPETVKQHQLFCYDLKSAKTVILPKADTVKGVLFSVVNKIPLGMPFVLTVTGEQNINGLPSLLLATGQSATLVSLGDQWVTV